MMHHRDLQTEVATSKDQLLENKNLAQTEMDAVAKHSWADLVFNEEG